MVRLLAVVFIGSVFVTLPSQASAQHYVYYHAYHPVPGAFGGGVCDAEEVHPHEYVPVELDYYALKEGIYYYLGDPGDEVVEEIYWYEDHHPVPMHWGGGICYLVGPHRHWWAPHASYAPHYVVLNGRYVYRGSYGPRYQPHRRIHPHAHRHRHRPSTRPGAAPEARRARPGDARGGELTPATATPERAQRGNELPQYRPTSPRPEGPATGNRGAPERQGGGQGPADDSRQPEEAQEAPRAPQWRGIDAPADRNGPIRLPPASQRPRAEVPRGAQGSEERNGDAAEPRARRGSAAPGSRAEPRRGQPGERMRAHQRRRGAPRARRGARAGQRGARGRQMRRSNRTPDARSQRGRVQQPRSPGASPREPREPQGRPHYRTRFHRQKQGGEGRGRVSPRQQRRPQLQRRARRPGARNPRGRAPNRARRPVPVRPGR